MDAYDPNSAPDPAEWKALDEDARLSLVVEHHRQAAVALPNETLHATIHAVVENQLAERDQPVVEALERLTRQGLDRHETIHAIGSVVTGHLHAMLQERGSGPISHKRYYTRLKKLTAKRWLKGKW
jgi:hypothetical protein